jgi:DNA-binding NtrC family response regulator
MYVSSADPQSAIQSLGEGRFDAVVVRLPVRGWESEEMLEEIQRVDRRVPVLFQGEITPMEAVRLIKLGAFHFLPPGASVSTVEELLSPRADAGTPIEPWRRFLVGESPLMRNVADTIRLVGSRKCTVLITGETGTGKEMAARAIHAASNRAHLEMVAVNCSALPENLLEAELFGHVRGAFTGAVGNRAGRFEQANRGTLFLDEVAEMPLELQAKLLRVLQEREFQKLGSSETVKVDVRVIAACNVDLHERIRQGRFRQDLYYRLNVVPIVMPPLRRRTMDIPLLVNHFIDKVCRQEGLTEKQLTRETMERLRRHDWPGNVRQLENAIEMAVALSGDRDTLVPGDFPLPSVAHAKVVPMPVPAQIALPEEGLDFERVVTSIERGILLQALRRTEGNKKAAADLLGLKRTTLTAKLKALEAAS